MNKAHSKKHACSLCGASFPSNTALINHQKVHQEGQFECEFCGRKLKRKKTLEIHLRQHTSENPYSCDICEKEGKQYFCKSDNVLLRHKKDSHNYQKYLLDKQMAIEATRRNQMEDEQLLLQNAFHTNNI